MGITKEHSDMREHDVKRDITTRADIVVMVDAFYRKVRQDDLLGGVFHEVIKDDWPDHLDKMYRFWHTVLLHEREYFGSPFPPHAKLPIGKVHFDRWLMLFTETLDAHFIGEKKEEAMRQAGQMAVIFASKIQYDKDHPEVQSQR
jgi:hemoglobin